MTETAVAQQVEVLLVPDLVREISPRRDFRALIQLIGHLRSLRPHILHTHSSKTGILGRIAARITRVPVVLHTVHGFAFPFSRSRWVRRLYFVLEYIGGYLCDALIVLNEADRNIAISSLRVPARKVHLIANGVELSRYGATDPEVRRAFRREQFGVDNDEMLCIAMVGRLWQQKNPQCFLRAALQVLAETDRPVRFFFIGDGELRGELEQSILAAGYQDSISILGWRTDVPQLLAALDIFVLPSLWEGMPLAILEAMASRLPVVVSDIPGNRDLVADGIDGVLFPADDAVALAENLKRLITDSGRRKLLGGRARQKVIDQYQLQRRQEQVLALYRELLASRQGA